MIKVLFLDCDGVVVTTKSLVGKNVPPGQVVLASQVMDVMDQSCLIALRKILDATGAKIVFTTTRRISRNGLRDAFALNNASDIWKLHIGSTPNHGDNGHRSDEIDTWLGDNDGLVSKYAVIDDLDMKWAFKDAFFGTYIDDGLTDVIADKVIAYLNV